MLILFCSRLPVWFSNYIRNWKTLRWCSIELTVALVFLGHKTIIRLFLKWIRNYLLWLIFFFTQLELLASHLTHRVLWRSWSAHLGSDLSQLQVYQAPFHQLHQSPWLEGPRLPLKIQYSRDWKNSFLLILTSGNYCKRDEKFDIGYQHFFPRISEIPHRNYCSVFNVLLVIEDVLIHVDNSFNAQEWKKKFSRVLGGRNLTLSLFCSQPGAMGLHNLIGKLKKWIKILEEKAKLLPK